MMVSPKTRCLLSLSVLLLLSIAPTVTEVLQSMTQCAEFFLDKTPPQIPDDFKDQSRYKTICQTYRDKRRFMTLYDTENKIPVFSAYKYRGAGMGRPKQNWEIEPQLENLRNGKNMQDCDHDEYKNQASDNDYKNDLHYNRGHLFPSAHAYDKSDKMSTFTLTNIVPQAITFNQGSWETMENCVKCIMQNYCSNREGYVVTGAQPSPKRKRKQLKKQVNIPSMLWSAFCCYNNENWLASAHWGHNVPDKTTSQHMQMKTLAELQKQLNINVFPGSNCPLTKNVLKFYPEIKSKCPCSAQTVTESAPTTAPNRQQFIEVLYGSRRFRTFCKNVNRESLKFRGRQSEKLRKVCLKLKKDVLKSGDIDFELEQLLREILNNSASCESKIPK